MAAEADWKRRLAEVEEAARDSMAKVGGMRGCGGMDKEVRVREVRGSGGGR